MLRRVEVAIGTCEDLTLIELREVVLDVDVMRALGDLLEEMKAKLCKKKATLEVVIRECGAYWNLSLIHI